MVQRAEAYVLLDPIAGMAFLLKDKREVLAFKFPAGDEGRSPT